MRAAGVLFALAVSTQGQNSKPSPIGYARAEAAARAAARSVNDTEVSPAPKKEAALQKSRDADTGPACFYRQKTVSPNEAESAPEDAPLNASHPTLPLGTRVKVTNLSNKKSVIVSISERSAPSDYVICVNYPAAEKLGLVRSGVAQVHLEKFE